MMIGLTGRILLVGQCVRVILPPTRKAIWNLSSLQVSNRWNHCWSCGSNTKNIDLFCQAPKCGVIQGIKAKEVNVFETFGLPVKYDIDLAHLDREYKELQKKLHPDKFATKSIDEKTLSTNASSAINLSYHTLKDPVCRAEYMVKLLFQREALSEKSMNQSISMVEMFEWREKVFDVSDGPSLKALKKELYRHFNEVQTNFGTALSRNDGDGAVDACVRMKYFSKMLEELDQKS